ncbi:MAG: Asp-tRNA(Asn)/Glu-tRNA(Gln) amidotransferase subunit GatA [Patescibacteria group bacterium]|nr:Asp-tRNA(Asn)/Glu-tRNA(Gln) amidotransferase subunit GatA [Patescibacteria group bacterium]
MDVSSLTIRKIQKGLTDKKFSCEDLTKTYLGNIQKTDKEINAFITVFDKQAVEEARRVDGLISKGKKLLALEGVPLAIKDNMLVSGQKCTAGSKILENYVAPYDATVVKKIKKQGGIILGKTNLDEFAMGASGEYSAYGVTKNPHSSEHVPGGSSSGSAAAVSADMCPVALGSDTAGSVRYPSSLCGVVGMKPTYGAVSRCGLIAMASSLDQIGPIAKNVEDAEILFNEIKGKDSMDATSYEQLQEISKKIDIKNLRIGVVKECLRDGIQKEIIDITKASIDKLEKQGAKIETVSLPHIEYGIACYYIIMPAEASSNLARYDGVKFGKTKEAKDLLNTYLETRGEFFGKEVKRRIMLGTYCLSAGYYDSYYLKAQKVIVKIKEDFDNIFKKVDLLLTPTSPFLPFKLGERLTDPLSMYMADLLTVPANLAGLPAISVPAGSVGKLPVGIQFMAPQYEEERIFKIAKFFETL